MDAINNATGVWVTSTGPTSQGSVKQDPAKTPHSKQANPPSIPVDNVNLSSGNSLYDGKASYSDESNKNRFYNADPASVAKNSSKLEHVRDIKPLIIDHKSLNSKAARAFQDIAQFKTSAPLIDTFA